MSNVPARVVIERVGVVGCGLMGSGIAEVCARAGLDVIVARGRRRRRRGRPGSGSPTSLDRAARGGKLTEAERDARVGRCAFTTDLGELADRQLVVEAVIEDEAAEDRGVQRPRQGRRADDAILASNTSSIPIMKLGMATQRPEQVVGIHFFNPVPVLQPRRARHRRC